MTGKKESFAAFGTSGEWLIGAILEITTSSKDLWFPNVLGNVVGAETEEADMSDCAPPAPPPPPTNDEGFIFNIFDEVDGEELDPNDGTRRSISYTQKTDRIPSTGFVYRKKLTTARNKNTRKNGLCEINAGIGKGNTISSINPTKKAASDTDRVEIID